MDAAGIEEGHRANLPASPWHALWAALLRMGLASLEAYMGPDAQQVPPALETTNGAGQCVLYAPGGQGSSFIDKMSTMIFRISGMSAIEVMRQLGVEAVADRVLGGPVGDQVMAAMMGGGLGGMSVGLGGFGVGVTGGGGGGGEQRQAEGSRRPAPAAPPAFKACASCGRTDAPKLKLCARCKAVRYCSQVGALCVGLPLPSLLIMRTCACP
jgi:hypothetical protein